MKNLMKSVPALLTVLASFSQPTASAGSVLYVSDPETQQLYVLSPTDASSASLVGNFGAGGLMVSLAYDVRNDILYGNTINPNNLYKINRSTGAATLIGGFGLINMKTIVFDNLTGTLYGSQGAGPSSSFYRIDTSTGFATLIGPIGVFGDNSVSGLSFNPQSNVLYGITGGPYPNSYLITINPSTGAGTLVAAVSPPPIGHAFRGISFDPDTGILYGMDSGGQANGTGPSKGLYTIDVATGTPTLRGLPPINTPTGIVFVVPEPSTIVLLGIGVLCLLAYGLQFK
jgi:hypothetical protein